MKNSNTLVFIIRKFREAIFLFSFILCPLLFVVCPIGLPTVQAQWVQTSNGMGNTLVNSLATRGLYLFAGAKNNPVGQGIYFTGNNGSNWTQTSLNNREVWALTIAGNNIFAGTWYFGVYLSTDSGNNWSQTSLGNGFDVSTLASTGSYIFAGTDFGGVYLSTNNGTNWSQTSLGNRCILSLAASGSNVFAGVNDSGVYVSTNNGINWNRSKLTNRYILSLAVNVNTIYAGSAQYLGLYKSTNNGVT